MEGDQRSESKAERRGEASRLVVGMTSLPSRIGQIRPAIDSLLTGDRVPDAIILSLPRVPLRGHGAWRLPDFLSDTEWHSGRVRLSWIDGDFGPGSKLLGALPLLGSDDLIVLADDDVRYHAAFLVGLEAALRQPSPRAAFSYYSYRLGVLRVGQGCDGFAMTARDVATARTFFDRHVAGTDAMYVDDLWISHLLAMQGVAVRSLPVPSGAELVYRQVHEIDALRDLTGPLARDRLNRVEAARLRRAAPIPIRQRAAMALRSLPGA